MNEAEKHNAVETFRRYLQIPSVHPNVNYEECIKFLKVEAESMGLPIVVYTTQANKPVVIISKIGTKPELQSLFFNSHMDVVPVFKEKWKYPPFEAHKDKDGNIYARGSQDMKCVSIQYLEAVRRYVKEGLSFKRTIHLSFVADEEIGGAGGMGMFAQSDDFRRLNVGCALDEGIASPTEEMHLFYAERSIWHFDVVCPGTGGHGSIIHENTAGEKIRSIIDKFMDFRAIEKNKLLSNKDLKLGDVTTVNLTKMKGGIQSNVVPPELTVSFDVRLAIDVDHEKMAETFEKWCSEVGEDVKLVFTQRDVGKPGITRLDDSNVWWKTFKSCTDKIGLKLNVGVFSGGTDGRFLRMMGIPAFGFSPMNYTPVLLHDHDEYLNENIFLRGIDIYYEIIQHLASV